MLLSGASGNTQNPSTHTVAFNCKPLWSTRGSTEDVMRDVPNVGGTDGEILTYLERVGGGNEFRANDEMRSRWFDADGRVREDLVRAADVHELITPSRERALALNKAYGVIVREQAFLYGRDATIEPSTNVYDVVDLETVPTLPKDRQFRWDIRLDWGEPGSG
jgi:hypothetical protein